MTLHQLRALLERAQGPAVERLTDRTPEGVARAYLPHTIRASHMYRMVEHAEHRRRWVDVVLNDAVRLTWNTGSESLDRIQAIGQQKLLAYDLITPETGASDPGTVVAVRAALALARGFDPSNGVKWTRNGADNAWILDAGDWCAFATSTAARSVTPSRRVIEADLVGMEPDSTRALILAVEHVLGAA